MLGPTRPQKCHWRRSEVRLRRERKKWNGTTVQTSPYGAMYFYEGRNLLCLHPWTTFWAFSRNQKNLFVLSVKDEKNNNVGAFWNPADFRNYEPCLCLKTILKMECRKFRQGKDQNMSDIRFTEKRGPLENPVTCHDNIYLCQKRRPGNPSLSVIVSQNHFYQHLNLYHLLHQFHHVDHDFIPHRKTHIFTFPHRYYPGPGTKVFEMHYQLPKDLTCRQCVFQWRYVAGNNWGEEQVFCNATIYLKYLI